MKPLTRKEMLLDGAAKGNLDNFKPATREEVFAKRALANAGGSGGVTMIYAHWESKYLYSDEAHTTKLSALELDAIINNGDVRIMYADEYITKCCFPMYYFFDESWGSTLAFRVDNDEMKHTSEYAEEG